MPQSPLDVSNLEALLESAQLLHASLDLDELLKHLLRTAMGRLVAARGVVGTYDGAVANVYVDGVLRNSHEYSGPMYVSPSDLEIGRDPSNPSRFFDGLIDEVRIYDRALTASEVERLYDADDDEFPWQGDAVPSRR